MVSHKRMTKEANRNSYENYEKRQSGRSNSLAKKSNKDSESVSQYDGEGVLEIYKNWRLKKIDGNSKRIYIKDCKLSSLNLEISFLARRSMSNLGGKTA